MYLIYVSKFFDKNILRLLIKIIYFYFRWNIFMVSDNTCIHSNYYHYLCHMHTPRTRTHTHISHIEREEKGDETKHARACMRVHVCDIAFVLFLLPQNRICNDVIYNIILNINIKYLNV